MNLILSSDGKPSISAREGKRVLDLALTIPIVFLLLPFLLILAPLVQFKLGSPVLFRQERSGLQGRPFTLLKFRTMTSSHDERDYLLPDSARTTRFGQLIRSLSLDELTELFNVLKGEMHIVGPRPLLMEYLGRCSSAGTDASSCCAVRHYGVAQVRFQPDL